MLAASMQGDAESPRQAALPRVSDLPRLEMARVDDGVPRPVIDGRLDEEFWTHAFSITEFVQVVPIAGAAPSEATEILLAFDDDNVYVGLRCYDRDPSGIRATQMARDANLDPDDRVEMLFDTFGDKRNGFWFQLGPAGSKGDALISGDGSNFNKRWETIWDGASEVTEDGWFGELRISCASINFDPLATHWRFNTRRFIRRRSEEVRWASPEPRLRFFSPANAGELHGIRGLHQGLGIDFVPFFAPSYTHLENDSEHWLGDTGFDLFYRISPSTKLSFSYNTDFAETEVDSRAVNLSRFELFFPEKRKFFLEDSGVFAFASDGSSGAEPIPFFSRRVGLDASGDEVPLFANIKLTSMGDGYSLGLLDSQTEDSAAAPARNLFVGRFKKNILEQSSVGVIYTHGDPTGATDDYTAGADLTLRTRDFLGDKSLRFQAYLLGTESATTSGNNLAHGASLAYPNDEVEASLGYTTIEENFDPALGFVSRTGIRQYDGDFSYNPRINTSVRKLSFGLEPRLTTDMSGRTQNKSLEVTPLGIVWESGEEFRLEVTPQQERLDEDFAIQAPVVIPAGTYDYVRYGAELETSDKRDVSTQVNFTTGTFFDGWRNDYSASVDWRASASALFSATYRLNDIRLDAGSFDVNIASFKADFHFNPRTSWANYVQWDDASEDLGFNSRLRIIFDPGRDLYIVLNQGWTTFGDHFAATSTDLRFKVSYTFRF